MPVRRPKTLSVTDLRLAKINQKIKPSNCSRELMTYMVMLERAGGDTFKVPYSIVRALESCEESAVIYFYVWFSVFTNFLHGDLQRRTPKLNLSSILKQYTK
jgi:hypothetical protein